MRLALCRCGQSRNKPYCDNSHRAAGFDDPGVVADGGTPVDSNTGLIVTATQDGPLVAEGALMIHSANGQGRFSTTRVELCRCGHSKSKPFCDGTHQVVGFRSE